MGNPRKVALNVLLKIANEGAYSNIALSNELSNTDLSNQDKALATAIIYGVLDRNITLEYVLKKYIKTRSNRERVKAPKFFEISGLYF